MVVSRIKSVLAAAVFSTAAVLCAYDNSIGYSTKLTMPESPLQGFNFSGVRELDAKADIYEYVGDNVIARGHVTFSVRGAKLTADKAIINLKSQDFEAYGNISFSNEVEEELTVSHDEYRNLLKNPDRHVVITGSSIDPTGLPLLKIKIKKNGSFIRAERITGNLLTGSFKFKNLGMKSGFLYILAAEAIRQPDGRIDMKKTKISTCDYIMDEREHYSFTSSSTTLFPRRYNSGIKNYNDNTRDHSILIYNPVFRLYDIPLMWAPVLFKPWGTDTFGIDFKLGSTSELGSYYKFSKGLTLAEDPYFHMDAMVDYYSKRGLGWGAAARLLTGNSKTEFFAYGIRDRKPYEMWDVDSDQKEEQFLKSYRMKIPNNRYDFKITNVTHITPRLDFRGQFEKLSDFEILRDYFPSRYNSGVQPPTFAGLEYQFDHSFLEIYGRFRVNSFDTVNQRLPEIMWDVPRMELFKGLYYQGENQFTYNQMKFRDFDVDSRYGNIPNYDAARFDTLHFLYYPINLFSFLNIVPRAGFRLTAWSDSSEVALTDAELTQMFAADNLEGRPPTSPFKTFETGGGSKIRFMAEFGVDVNTKIYRTWNNVRSSWLELDGLRHVMIPFVSYTFIPEPTGDTDKIFYFDNIDRLSKQNFFRVGLTNRLETRTGSYGSETIRRWGEVSAYFDYHLNSEGDYNHMGDVTIKMNLTPTKNLTLTAETVLDAGDNKNAYKAQNGYDDFEDRGLAGIGCLNRLIFGFQYAFNEDLKFTFNYDYQDCYAARSVYSMGSTMDVLTAMTFGMRSYYTRSQTLSSTLSFPTYIDPTLKGMLSVSYDVDEAILRDLSLSIVKQFHCIDVGFSAGRYRKRDSDGDMVNNMHFSLFVRIHAMPGFGYNMKSETDN